MTEDDVLQEYLDYIYPEPQPGQTLIYIEPTTSPASDITIAYALKQSDLPFIATREPQPEAQTAIATLEPNVFHGHDAAVDSDHMNAIITIGQDAPFTIPVPIYMHGDDPKYMTVRMSTQARAATSADDLEKLLYAALHTYLDDKDWEDWSDFQYLRNNLLDDLHNLATAVLGNPLNAFENALRSHMDDFFTPIQRPSQPVTVTHQNYMGTFTVQYQPPETGQ